MANFRTGRRSGLWWAGVVGLLSTQANAQNNFWNIQRTGDNSVVATLATDHFLPSGKVLTTLLNVAFEPEWNCRPEIGFALLDSANYGKPIGKLSPPSTEPLTIVVDGIRLPTPLPYVAKYDNGLEVTFLADGDVFQTLLSGTIVTIQLVSGTPRFEFDLSGIDKAAAEAKRRCLSSR